VFDFCSVESAPRLQLYKELQAGKPNPRLAHPHAQHQIFIKLFCPFSKRQNSPQRQKTSAFGGRLLPFGFALL
jgi:hypothetical protein